MRSSSIALIIAACAPPATNEAVVAWPDPKAASDPLNRVDVEMLSKRSERIFKALVERLPEKQRELTQITLRFDDAHGEVNAYASCGLDGHRTIGVSNGMIVVAAHVAMATATDDVFATDKRSAYHDWVADHAAKPPPAAFYDPVQHIDRRKITRQWEIFDAEMAFVLGHELAHHALGHLPCTPRGRDGDIGHGLELPVFSQANELAADAAGVKSLLAANWSEEGALRLLSAFHRESVRDLGNVVLAFAMTHPLPAVRVPLIVATAELWHNTGGHLPP